MDLQSYRQRAKSDWFDRISGVLVGLLAVGSLLVGLTFLVAVPQSIKPVMNPSQRAEFEAYRRYLRAQQRGAHPSIFSQAHKERMQRYGRRLNESYLKARKRYR